MGLGSFEKKLEPSLADAEAVLEQNATDVTADAKVAIDAEFAAAFG